MPLVYIQRTPANIHINLMTDTIGLSLLVNTQLSLKATNSQAQHNSVKTEFNVKWPFIVIQNRCILGSVESRREDYHYIISLITPALSLKVLKTAVVNNPIVVWNWCLCPGSLREYWHKPYIARIESLGYIFAAIVWVYLHSYLVVGFEKCVYFETEWVMAVPCRRKFMLWSLILASIKSTISSHHSHLMPSRGVNLFEFLDDPYIAKIELH